jgi:pimeloyl-ACP methyl ester carboxylesterase
VFDAWEIELHGHQVVYRVAGEGPPVVLIHGMVNASRHWRDVAERLAERHTVIAPDLIGHGDSATPRGDYSLGAHASVIRDLLSSLGVERATMVGHSLGVSNGWRWSRAAASGTRSARCCAARRCRAPACSSRSPAIRA